MSTATSSELGTARRSLTEEGSSTAPSDRSAVADIEEEEEEEVEEEEYVEEDDDEFEDGSEYESEESLILDALEVLFTSVAKTITESTRH